MDHFSKENKHFHVADFQRGKIQTLFLRGWDGTIARRIQVTGPKFGPVLTRLRTKRRNWKKEL